MSTDYFLVCYTCKTKMRPAFASGAGFSGFKVWDEKPMLAWLGHGEAVGHHEGHDLRVVSEHADLPGETDDPDTWWPEALAK